MPSHDFRSPRLFVESDLSEGQAVPATPVQANYLHNVMRLGEGDTVLAFNSRDGEWRCDLTKPSKKKLELLPRERVRDQTPPAGLHYLFAPLKHARLDYTVQKAVEMGAGVLQPVMTQHVQASRLNIERMRANAVEAAEQCGILSIPECREPVKFTDMIAGWDHARSLVFCDEREEAESPIDTLRAIPQGPLALLIGPEGGFSAKERATLQTAEFVTTISLGPRILRADTAAVAALAVLQASIGDWREG
ncbi:16S rRNA (uracil(1498)-N(3))-methyltransferase [Aurantimonas sp. C2-6-R+9]|uniref:16S rRNA (uracil(1498)-N(3))-methyltransferase n=1 Tax=unclassified Aurantimonas TaxID=2638230 RepID=UPI002E17FADF|nr:MULTISPECIES: 16S rRNA (uracil(1498)-N(3))-methyltransferase [unclassified Aurantimonas]MEC5291085.1 16S rRNA (uracil(1498)-N(3))-methyltransferase [Aurantimonas sp. C2-3-R2]MEC5381413.1 16S rRNA (uracil(1498)-N(3))-methyltransferase [Aurantimonas sp. C2-6-R+9]MEC5412236.1 16S rRNA (uracil(1498)-N(3))-methyltransferase [Aurantimonas sp. C2-4-R8]